MDIFWQLSIITTFHSILVEQKSCPSKEYANIVDFLTSFVRRMLRKMKSQPILFVEILFWKTRRESHYINAEYLVHEIGSLKKDSRNWENILEDAELGSSQAKGWTRRNIADALGEDEADVVISHELGYQK
jgi:timeless